MKRFDVRDLIAGLSVIVIGSFFAIQSFKYDVGTVRAMGPGFFPFALSLIFIFLGFCILVPALISAKQDNEDYVDFQLKELFVVISATVVFALTVRNLGVFISVVCTVAVVSFAGKVSFLGSIALGIVASILCYLVFVLGLGMRIPAWPWSY